MRIKYQKEPGAQFELKRAQPLDSGLDVFSNVDFQLNPGQRETFSTRIRFEIKKPWWMYLVPGLGLEIQVRPKSGISKRGVEASLGTVDELYRGWTGVTLHNHSDRVYTIVKDQKIAQIVLCPVFNNVQFYEGDVSTDTARGEAGFGSSGLK